jgi:hypothetical protein
MKKFDLDSELRASRVPERDQAFWDAFPHRVMAELRAAPATPPVRVTSPPRLGWGFGMAVACVVVVLCLWQTRAPRMLCYDVIQNERAMRQTVRQFPRHLRALMQDEHGLGKLVEDQP